MLAVSVHVACADPQFKTHNSEFRIADKLVVVVANRLLLSDLEDPKYPTIAKMLREGAVALISPNCAGPKTENSVLLTAGAGASCRGVEYVGECYDANERLLNGELASDAYFERTGFHTKPDSAVFLGIAQTFRENAKCGDNVQIGACGEALRVAGKKTCAIGNADTRPLVINRAAAVLAMDLQGFIDFGKLGCSPDVRVALRKADFVVVNWGDSTVLDEGKIAISDRAYAAQKVGLLRGLDELLRLVLADSKRDWGGGVRIVLVSFSPPTGDYWKDLTPIVIYPSRTKGLLTSPSTRTPGLITASDFAPTVLGLMGVQRPVGMVGRPAAEVRCSKKLNAIHDLGARVQAGRVLELPLLWIIAIIGIVALTVASLIIAFGLKASPKLLRALRMGLLMSGCAPVGMLLAAAAPAGVVGYAVGTVVGSLIVMAIALAASKYIKLRGAPVVLVFALTALIILVDSALGGTMCKFSLPSSYQFSGFRFYGIGNEYAGLLISVAALAVIMAGQGIRERLVWPVAVLVIVFLGFGRLGANFGAIIPTVLVFGLVALAFRKNGFTARQVAAAFIAGIVIAGAFAVIDWKLSASQGSHAARMMDFVEKIGASRLVDTAVRKVLMNLRITSSHTAERAIMAFVPFIALWLWGVQGKIKKMFEADKAVIAGLKAVLIGAVAAFIVEDSGIVMAGMMIAMMALVLLYSLLEEAAKPCQE